MNPQAILFGNGLNRLTAENPSWEELLQQTCQRGSAPLHGSVPYTLMHENLFLSDKADLSVPQRIEGRTAEYKVKWKIANASLDLKENPYYHRLAKLNVQHYLTTNYDACLDFTLEKYGLHRVECSTQEFIYSIARYARYAKPDKWLWNIHGFAKYPSSLMIGYNQFCGSINKMKDLQSLEFPILERLRKGDTKPLCWGDFFYTHDVHIIGLSLDYSDIDLWWMLSERKRLMKVYPELIQNQIHYYYTADGKADRQFEQLLRSMGVTVHEYVVNRHHRKAIRWTRVYDQIFATLEEQLGTLDMELAPAEKLF